MPRTLFISNPSKQDVIFPYRLSDNEPLTKSPNAVPIPSGQQVELGHRWTEEQKAYVIKQLELHGGRDAAEAHAPLGKFTGLLFRDGFEISENEIHYAHEETVKTLTLRSKEQFTNTAAAIDASINPGRGGKRRAQLTELSLRQELPPGERPKGDEVDFSMKIAPDGYVDQGAAA